MKHYFLKFFNVVIALDVLVLVYGAYLVFWPFPTITVKSPDRILNASHQVRAGEALAYQISYCKYTPTQATVTKALIGAVTYGLPSSTNNVPTGCTTAITRNTIIPIGIAPGRYRLELTATYQLNPLRSISVRHDSETFEVLPSNH